MSFSLSLSLCTRVYFIQGMFAHGCVMILVSKSSGKSLRSFHGTAQGIGGQGAHGMILCQPTGDNYCPPLLSTPHLSTPLLSTPLQLSGKFIYADLELSLYRICTRLSTGLPYVTDRPLEMYFWHSVLLY